MSEKTFDGKGRWRCVTVGFRMSPEENETLNTKVYLSGLTKQDYIIACVLKKEIIVQGSPRTYKALKNTLCGLVKELKENGSYTDEQHETLQLVVKLLEGFRDNAEHLENGHYDNK
jgi:hypothetical protein